MDESNEMVCKDSKLKRKEKIYQKLRELTQSLSSQKSADNVTIGFGTQYISQSLNICRSNVSKELNQLLREGKVSKILGKPVLYLDRVSLFKEMNVRTDSTIIKSYEEARQLLMFGINNNQPGTVHKKSLESVDNTKIDLQKRLNTQKSPSASIKGNSDSVFDNIIGVRGSLKSQVEQAKAAILYPPNGLHTLLVGATGVGKSTFSEAMYKYAVQSGKFSYGAPFVVFNCADYAENPQLLLSQLFGHLKGAFTGADKEKKGLIDKANGGILFLDEVHRLPPEGQEMMFSLMDKGTYRRMGESENTHNAKVLIIAATTEDLKTYMLNTFLRRIPVVIKLPSIKELNKKEKMSIIFSFFEEESKRVRVPIKVANEVLQGFLFYDGPGNIGQLKSDIQLVCARSFLDYMTIGGTLMEVKISHVPWTIQEGFLKGNEKTIIESFLTINENGEEMFDNSSYLDSDKELLFNGLQSCENEQIMGRIFEDDYSTGENFYDHIVTSWKKFYDEGLSDKIIHQKMARYIGNYFQSLFPKIKHKEYDTESNVKLKDTKELLFQAVREVLEEMGNDFKEFQDQQIIYGLALHVGTLLERLKVGKKIYHPYKGKIVKQYPDEYKAADRFRGLLEGKLSINIPEDEVAFLTMFLYGVRAGNNKNHIGVLVIAYGKSVASSIVEVANALLNNSNVAAIDVPIDEKIEIVLEKSINEVKRLDMGNGVIIMADMGSLTRFSELITDKTGIMTRTVEMVSTPMVLEALRKSIRPDMSLDMLVQHVRNAGSYFKPSDNLAASVNGENRDSISMESVLVEMLANTLIFLEPQKAYASLGCVLRNIFQELNHPIDSRITIKFIFHCSCMIERLIRKEPLPYEELENILHFLPEVYNTLKKQFELVEDTFGIVIPDTEFAYILEMINTHINSY